MHVCLFGGAFDPPHQGHLEVARYLLAEHICDEVWFVPVKQHPFGKNVAVNGHRSVMLKLMLEEHMRVEEYEVEHAGKSYSIDTLRALSVAYPNYRFSWVIGTDNLSKFQLWDRYEALLKAFTVYVYPREGSAFDHLLPGMIPLEQAPLETFSSTDIRNKIKAHQNISGLVDPKVEQYIRENHLYH